MKTFLLTIICSFCSIQMFYSQEEDGVVSLALPVRNSLTFNRYTINPTFSFVREQNKYISIYNKKEWVQFDDAPQTYLAGYSGRFAENIGAGVGVFQQDYGVLTTFGGILNFAYNARLKRDSNLTFGLNLGVYKSGLNTGKVITNFADPSLDNVPSHLLLTVNPGINYGTKFMDFGVSINNLVLYNVQASELLQDDPRQTLQAHMMYTGYIYSDGFFDESKFSGLLRSEFGKDDTTISGIAMLTVPKGIWAQVGYNTLYGASAGLGINITKQIAIEYNFEKAIGDLTHFGPSHEITLAFKLNNNSHYDYSAEDEMSALINSDNKRVLASSKPRMDAETRAQLLAESAARREEIRERAQGKAETRAQIAAENKARIERQSEAKIAAEIKAKQEEQERAAAVKATADALAKSKTEEIAATEPLEQKAREAQEKLDAQNKAQAESEAIAKRAAESKAALALQDKSKAEAKAKAEAQAKLAAEAKAKAEQEAKERVAAQNKAKEEAEAKAKLAAEVQAKADADAKAAAQLAAAAKAKQDAEAQLALETNAKIEAEQAAKLAAEEKASQEAKTAEAVALTQAKTNQEAEALAKIETESAALAKEEDIEEEVQVNPTDAIGMSMKSLADVTSASKNTQDELLARFNAMVVSKDQDLKDLKEENDLSEQGIYSAPKAFKSITEENNALLAIRSDLDKMIDTNTERIKELESLYNERIKIPTLRNDEVTVYYQKTIQTLKAEQAKAIQTRAQLSTTLKEINEATEFERKRRIKRAAFTNEEDRYVQDRAALKMIKESTPLSPVSLKAEDFNFGEEQGNNIQIIKNVKNIESGYYVVVAVHNDAAKRDEFLRKAVAAGQSNIDFFYDVNTSRYFIYYKKLDSIDAASEAMKTKGNQPYNGKMSIIKIEN
ncbi:PorP/SprF family type IX secretion system membrane protein [Gelidibacter pelagius]|uniref:PorP/SprF family type IX secretion system membrane protein n=1 Tax=Gelidibacter pelagius TaxID=2819985 RepID=A0ABS3SR35_9FLAO|nr:PorP/SprF family type IX secretion system membrane protein [Gelidibacter pelagius]MBO3097791.1 PorP/SprF family type IX secretion system membrane protein [Gelidibacter pelagius]